MILTWLIEIYLNQLGTLKEQGEDNTDGYEQLQEEFRKFLAQPRVKDCMNYNRNTIYDLIASHGNVEDMVFFAFLMQGEIAILQMKPVIWMVLQLKSLNRIEENCIQIP